MQCADIIFEGVVEMNKLIHATIEKLHFLGGIAIVAMTIVMTLDVVARYALNSGVPDTMDISSMLLGAVTCLSLAFVTEKETHIRFSMLTDAFSLRAQRFSQVLTLLIGVFTFGLLSWQATIRSISIMRSGDFVGTLQIPMWPTMSLFAFGCLLTLVVLVSQLVAHFMKKEEC
jgi:TRAP-type C4-dicarboxylate transport system permease small subunit